MSQPLGGIRMISGVPAVELVSRVGSINEATIKNSWLPYDNNAVALKELIIVKASTTEEEMDDGMWETLSILALKRDSYAWFCDEQVEERMKWSLRGKEYGGVNIVFAGDLRQLEPFEDDPIYNEWFPEFHLIFYFYFLTKIN